MDKGGDLRRFLQGLIHVAVGFYHLRDSNHVGAFRQLNKAYDKLSGYLNVDTGINMVELLTAIDYWIEKIKLFLEDPEFDGDFGRFPKFRYDEKKILAAA